MNRRVKAVTSTCHGTGTVLDYATTQIPLVEATAPCFPHSCFRRDAGFLSRGKVTTFVAVNVDAHLSFLAKGGRFLS